MSYLFYVGWVLLTALAVYSWVPMFRCYGWRCLSMVPTMWRLHSGSKRMAHAGRRRTPFVREVIQYLIAAAVCFYFGGFWSLIGGTCVTLAIARVFFAGRIPVILLLGTSSPNVLKIQRRLIGQLNGAMVASLLDVNAAVDGKYRYAGYVFRTFEDPAWKACVDQLAAFAALIVFDTRADTGNVEYEAKKMIQDHPDKMLFVMNDDGSMPTLEKIAITVPIPAINETGLAQAIESAGVKGLESLPQNILAQV